MLWTLTRHRVRCPHDGTPMYQAEIDLEKRGFRLWRCPQGDGRRTTEEGLGRWAPQEIHDVKGKNGVDPMNRPNIASGRTDQPRLARHENHSLRGDKFQTDSKSVVFHC